jgi:hypothetical protein
MRRAPTTRRLTHGAQLFLCGVVFLSGLACSQAPAAQRIPEELLILPGAAAVRSTGEHAGTVSYDVEMPYPATQATEAIRAHLERRGWTALAEDFLNPGLPTSVSRGWTAYEELAPQGGSRHIFQWVTDWEDKSGRIVRYALRYDATRAPNGELRPHGRLRVIAILHAADWVKAARSVLKPKPPR